MIETKNKCYVLHKGFFNKELLEHKNDLIMWPEDGLSLLNLASGIKYEASIVTENPWLISCYSSEDVFIYENGEWVNPRKETYGTSINLITSSILKIRHSIPAAIVGDETVQDLREKISNLYK